MYKSHAYDFGDSKASVLGDYVASSLGMEEGEVPLYMVVTPDYKGWMLFFFQNGKCAKVPLSSYETKQNRRKLLKAYSDKEELACMRYLPAETELAIFTTNGRLLLAGSAPHSRKGYSRQCWCERCNVEKRTPRSPASLWPTAWSWARPTVTACARCPPQVPSCAPTTAPNN